MTLIKLGYTLMRFLPGHTIVGFQLKITITVRDGPSFCNPSIRTTAMGRGETLERRNVFLDCCSGLFLFKRLVLCSYRL